MKLIVGLGNPGERYARTRHNVGWLVTDELVRRAGLSWRRQGDLSVAEWRVGSEKVWLAQPQTFMNSAGRAVGPFMDFYKLSGDDLLVVQDDLDSPFGLLRLRPGGRHGGQNGVRDLIARLGHDRFARLKIGISRPPAGRDPADWVLSRWASEEQATLDRLVTLGADAATLWAEQGLGAAQQAFNGTDLRLRPPAEPAEAQGTEAPAPSYCSEK